MISTYCIYCPISSPLSSDEYFFGEPLFPSQSMRFDSNPWNHIWTIMHSISLNIVLASELGKPANDSTVRPFLELLGKRYSLQRRKQRTSSVPGVSGSHLSTLERACLKLTPTQKKADPKNRDRFLTTLSILNQGMAEASVSQTQWVIFHLGQ